MTFFTGPVRLVLLLMATIVLPTLVAATHPWVGYILYFSIGWFYKELYAWVTAPEPENDKSL